MCLGEQSGKNLSSCLVLLRICETEHTHSGSIEGSIEFRILDTRRVVYISVRLGVAEM